MPWELAGWIDVATLPTFEVLDTRSAQGRLDRRVKTITVADLVLAHGHACDGLLRAVWAMRALFDVAFAGEPIDRSDLRVVSKNSPCLGDVAAYLTGARTRFGTHLLDNSLGVGFQLQRLSSGESWEVREEAGFFPQAIIDWENALLRDELSDADKAQLLAVHEAAQWNWVREVLFESAPADHYAAHPLEELILPEPLLESRRSDTVNRLVPAPINLASPDDPALEGQFVDNALTQHWTSRYEEGAGA